MTTQSIVLAGGCFWGMEALYRALPGVTDVVPGYANGDSEAHAVYEIVCSGTTGFREAVRVTYDPARISLEHLLFVFFAVIDPTTPFRQGMDIGAQYQTGIYWQSPEQEAAARTAADIERAAVGQFCVELRPLRNFYGAEEYHRRYLEKNPGGYCHIAPGRIAALGRYPFAPGSYTRPARELLQAWQDTQ
jgi:methionine-S-sulfoxide reductase